MTTIIVLPWPDKRLTPNAKRRKHWSFYRPAANADRAKGLFLTLEALGADAKRMFDDGEPLPLTIRFYPPDRRHRDDDGMIATFKHMRDGIADAIAVEDRWFRPSYQFCEPEAPGRVEVTIGGTHDVS